MRISSALLVALGCAAPAGKFYRPPSCYHCLQEEVRELLATAPAYLLHVDSPRRPWNSFRGGPWSSDEPISCLQRPRSLGRLRLADCTAPTVRPELLIDLTFLLPRGLYSEAGKIRLHFFGSRSFARWLLSPMVLPKQEEMLSSILEGLPGQQALSAVLSTIWDRLADLSAPPEHQRLAYWQRPLHQVLFASSWLSFLDPRLRLLLARLSQGSETPHPACSRCRGREVSKHVTADMPRRLLRRLHVEEISKNVYAFPAMTADFCRIFLEELTSFYASGLKSARPNSMNRYGAVLEEMGLALAVADFQRQVLLPLARAFFPSIGDELDGHHAFVVHYRPEAGRGDQDLPPHRDDSEVTFNMALGRSWQGCRLIFCGLMQEPDAHQHQISYDFPGAGWAVLHLGRQVHAAENILRGERTNLVIWSRSWVWRVAGGDGQLTTWPHAGPSDPRCLPARRKWKI
ncbi:Ogfod2, partial [Symbiodinium microadriaticum]